MKRFFCLVGSIFLSLSLYAQTETSLTKVMGQQVLLLHSYHSGYQWTDDISRGGRHALGDQINLHVEYLDTKRHYDESYMELLRELLEYRFRKNNFQVIISADNNAFELLLEHGRELFGHTPIVFTGLNNPPDKLRQEHSTITGVVEQIDYRANLELIKTLHPERKRLVFITDVTPTGIGVREEFEQAAEAFGDHFTDIEVWQDLRMNELLRKLTSLDKNSVVLYSLFFRDNRDIFYEYDYGTRLITGSSPVPVYGLWDFNLGHGILGGKLTSGYQQGLAAGRLARRLLAGQHIDKIPIQKLQNEYMFDYSQLKRFGTETSKLPEGSVIINQPLSFFREHLRLFTGILVAILVLLG
ncbi:MAG TPA: histidine kinase, partial [Sediminispirochaeta sp.]|nr:histidine kinase [Sediminispirochaeta sp.]